MSVRTGTCAPETFILNLSPATGVELASVTAAELRVRKPDGTTTTWACAMSNQSSTTLRLTHLFAADGSDLVKAGPYSIFARLTVPGGFLRSEPRVLAVSDAYDASA